MAEIRAKGLPGRNLQPWAERLRQDTRSGRDRTQGPGGTGHKDREGQDTRTGRDRTQGPGGTGHKDREGQTSAVRCLVFNPGSKTGQIESGLWALVLLWARGLLVSSHNVF
ncbi:hypothetical protein RRG08_021218 [Elysia crispata]|uniref:Uncharacterized protein n=1 Tax=Elysia crispata TaxID=231223 RepID=A0AAE1D771_9GAST|nr:hypothetical protein RRG08_021218 [Elysia crispata]